MKKILAMLLALVMVLSLAACGAAPAEPAAPADVITLRLADNQADGTPNVMGDQKFAELVKEYTGGEVVVEVINNGVLGDELSVADQIQLGTLDVARIGNIAPTCSAYKVTTLPYRFSNFAAMCAAYDGEFGQALAATLKDETGIINLTYFFSGARSFYTSEKPINGVADMAGMKIRAQDDPVTIAMFTALGANATPIAYAEVYSAIDTKIVDGAENDFVSYYTSGHYEVAPYYSLDMHTMGPSVFIMSEATWNSLSAEHQDAVMKAAADASQYQRTVVAEKNAEARAAVEAAGCTIIEVDVAEFQTACATVYDEYPELQQYIDLLK